MSSFSPFEDDSVELPTVKLYLKTNPTKGRGVFAGQDIPAGTLINISPVLTFPPAANADEVAPKKGTNQISPEREVLNSYTYTWRRVDDMQALALGLGSMFNHSRNSNVCFTLDKKNSVIRYSTLVRVAQDTELCINYGPRLWFEDVDGPEEAEAEGVGEAEAEPDDEDGMFGAFDLFSPGSSLPSTEASDLDSADAAAQRQCMEDVQDFDFNAAAAGSAHGKGCGRGNALGCEGDADDEAAAFGALKR